ncbi:hypothetical protein [uncultured Desulfobulbus sp.]|uniref:hypothetical protein n=1 Tax=uncultured Desulfobulbus sp. TaxID=239745 RepID=UPI0029C8360F|nr:hypothetical protein [uncultured Desulfobulbus sp.]
MTSQKRIDAMVWLLSKVGKEQITSLMPEFVSLTGLTHKRLMDSWQAHLEGNPSFLSCCNAFVIQYCHGINLPDKYVNFDTSVIKSLLVADRKEHAWVASGEGMPDSGDICIWKGTHMGICTQAMKALDPNDYKEGQWYTIEGGQTNQVLVTPTPLKDGKKFPTIDRDKSFDSIKRKKYQNFPADSLQGWIDIDKYFYGSTGNPDFKPEAEARNRQWINRDGNVAHPGAPDGSGGLGYFRANGTLPEDPFNCSS